MKRIDLHIVLTTVLVVAVASDARAQALQRRMASSQGNAVQFNFPARPGVCGDGRNFVRVDGENWFGTMNDYTRAAPCESGPVRVLVVKSGSEPIKLESYVGPLPQIPLADVIDLGHVTGSEAVAYLGSLITVSAGRVARDALTPLGLADSVDVSPLLLQLTRDQGQSREIRRSALGWLVRRREGSKTSVADLLSVVVGLAKDDNEHSAIRQFAVGQLSRFDRGEGIPLLIQLAQHAGDLWLARQSAEVLGRSGDPRARRTVRELVADPKVAAEVRAIAMSGLANEYGTAEDVDVLMRAFPALKSDELIDAALGGVASIGGATSRSFLIGLVTDEERDARARRRAAGLLDRVGVGVGDVIATYDRVSDGEVRGLLIDLLARAATRDATKKLVSIAKTDTQVAARKRAISALSRTDDPEVREALRGIVGQ